jgi:hypothetical protein
MPKPRPSPLLRANHIPVLFAKLSRALLRYLDASNRDGPEQVVARRVALAKAELKVVVGLLNHVASDFEWLEEVGRKPRLTRKEKRELEKAMATLERFFK